MSSASPSLDTVPPPPVPEPRLVRRSLLLLAWLLLCAALAWWFTPRILLADSRPPFKIVVLMPKAFGDWRIEDQLVNGIVNPQQNELVDKLYSEVVTRVYINSRGERVMLSIAYGRDQRDSLALHYPEVCYPAQGFRVLSNHVTNVQTSFGPVPARQLETQLGSQRAEPVTYWTTIGDHVVLGGIQKKFGEMRYGLNGVVPDGLLFRLSSIDRDSPRAFALHQDFTAALTTVLSPELRARFAGLSR